jgi:protein required for attachment to host cells
MEVTGKIAPNNLRVLRNRQHLAGGHENPRVWIVVADKEIARVYARKKGGLELIGEIEPVEDAVTELNNKSIGRNKSSGDSSVRHKYEPHMNESRQKALSFVHELSGWLKRMEAEDVFDHLVIAAPPEILGDMRAELDKHLRERVIAEIDKNLTRFNERTLQQELDALELLNF